MAYRRIYENLETHLSVMIILFMGLFVCLGFFLVFFWGGGQSLRFIYDVIYEVIYTSLVSFLRGKIGVIRRIVLETFKAAPIDTMYFLT